MTIECSNTEKKVGSKRQEMHHRYDWGCQVCGGFWWVSQDSTAPYAAARRQESRVRLKPGLQTVDTQLFFLKKKKKKKKN